MPVEINLLPKDMTSDKSVGKAIGLAKKIAMALGGLFLLVAGLGGAAYFFFFNNLNGLKADYAEAVAQVESLQSTEASLVFLKDRLQKTQSILGSRTGEAFFAKHRELLTSAPQDVEFKENRIDSAASTLEVKVPSSRSLVSLISTLVASSNFGELLIDELSFSPFVGYSVQFEVF